MEDETRGLVRDALRGGEVERSALLERLRPRLVLWAAARLSPALRAEVEPEDVAQEILLAVHQALDRFEGSDERAFRTWLYTIAENRIRDLADHYGALKRRTPEPRARTQTSPSGAAVRREEREHVHAALGRLGERHRRVIRLRRIEERETDEVARILGCTPNAVRILYCRALKALRAELAKRTGTFSA